MENSFYLDSATDSIIALTLFSHKASNEFHFKKKISYKIAEELFIYLEDFQGAGEFTFSLSDLFRY